MINGLHIHSGEWLLADWLEFIKPTTIEEESSHTDVAITFKYKQFIDDDGNRFPLPGMLTNGQTITIETSSDLEFKPEDKVRFPNDDGTTVEYVISNVSKINQTSNNAASFQFPGITEKYKRTIITF